MDYQIVPIGSVWDGGMFSVPLAVADKYIKLASEYQIKALLFILSSNGVCSSADIAKKLGITVADAENIMEFWVAEGVAVCKGETEVTVQTSFKAESREKIEIKSTPKTPETVNTVLQQADKKEKKSTAKAKLDISAPTLTPAEIVKITTQRPELEDLLNEAQITYGRTISHSEQEMIVNLVEFYGMRPEIVLMLLVYCRNERKSGRAVSPGYFYKIAENWLSEGIDTVAQAEVKISELENSTALWNDIKEAAQLQKASPTPSQREMIIRWKNDFSRELIFRAIEEMNENIDAPNLRYVDKILKNWKKAGIENLQQVEEEKERFEKRKQEKDAPSKSKTGEISRKPTYDLEKIKKDAMNNTEIKY